MPKLQALTLAALSCLHATTASAYPRQDVNLRTEYDYIIVGAGASGLTVANRLSEDPAATVLVIEAGHFDKNEDIVTIPGLAGNAVGTKYDWNLTYPSTTSLNGRNISIPLGKVVGGSTKLNRMVFDRGSQADYDRWAELGNRSNLTNNATFAAEARAEYDQQKKGPLTSPTADFLLFLPLSNYTSAASDIHKQATGQDGSKFLPTGTPAEVVKGYKKQQKVLNEKLLDTQSAILEIIWADGTSVLGLQHPYSRGSVKAKSSNIFDSPEANPEFLKNPLDLAILAEGVKFARKLSGAPSIKALNPFELVPGANVTSDSDLEQFIRSSASTLFHPAGSCKLGSRSEGGVVDEKLRVYGVKGLRIVDASVMPLLPATHTMTTVYAVAEKAADLIKSG
ncbi:GMC oxidoreductase [Fusarium oxysporum f. sp. phaseoli]